MTAPQSPPTPTIPPAVAQWLVERFDAEQSARQKSPAIRTMHLLTALTMQAEDAGIAILSADLHADGNYGAIYLGPVDGALAPALAVLLGLTDRRVHPHGDAHSIEAFYGYVEGMQVRTQHLIPTAALAADEPVRSAS